MMCIIPFRKSISMLLPRSILMWAVTATARDCRERAEVSMISILSLLMKLLSLRAVATGTTVAFGRDYFSMIGAKSDQEAGNQAQRRHRQRLLQQIPAQLPGRKAQGLQPGEIGPVLLRRHLHNGVNHEKAAHQHQNGGSVVRPRLLARCLHAGVVVGKIGGEGHFRQALVRQHFSRLFLQAAGLVQGDAQGQIGGVLAVVVRHQAGGGIRRNPGAGLGEVGGAGPPAAQGKGIRMCVPGGVRPLQGDGGADAQLVDLAVHSGLRLVVGVRLQTVAADEEGSHRTADEGTHHIAQGAGSDAHRGGGLRSTHFLDKDRTEGGSGSDAAGHSRGGALQSQEGIQADDCFRLYISEQIWRPNYDTRHIPATETLCGKIRNE